MQTALKRGAFLLYRGSVNNATNARFFSGSTKDVLSEKEKGAEKVYFDKLERKAMKKLLQKLEQESQLDAFDPSSADETARVKAIFSKYKVSAPDALISEIIDWKNNS